MSSTFIEERFRKDTDTKQDAANDASKSLLESAWGGVKSAVYTAIFEPLAAWGQTIDAVTDKAGNLQAKAESVAKAIGMDRPDAAHFDHKSLAQSANWYMQNLGSAVGMLLPFMAIKGGLKKFGNTVGAYKDDGLVHRGIGSIGSTHTVSEHVARETVLSSAAGSIYGGLFRPVEPDANGSIAERRLMQSLTDASVFGVLGLSTSLSAVHLGKLAGKLDTVAAESKIASGAQSILKGPILPGVIAAVPAGATSALWEYNQQKPGENKDFASMLYEHTYGMMFPGLAFGTHAYMRAKHEGSNKTNARHIKDTVATSLGLQVAEPVNNQAEFRVLKGQSKTYDQIYDQLEQIQLGSRDKPVQGRIWAQQKLDGLFGKAWDDPKYVMIYHNNFGLQPSSMTKRAAQITSCVVLEGDLAAKDIFPNRDKYSPDSTVWLNPQSNDYLGRRKFILNAGEEPLNTKERETIRPEKKETFEEVKTISADIEYKGIENDPSVPEFAGWKKYVSETTGEFRQSPEGLIAKSEKAYETYDGIDYWLPFDSKSGPSSVIKPKDGVEALGTVEHLKLDAVRGMYRTDSGAWESVVYKYSDSMSADTRPVLQGVEQLSLSYKPFENDNFAYERILPTVSGKEYETAKLMLRARVNESMEIDNRTSPHEMMNYHVVNKDVVVRMYKILSEEGLARFKELKDKRAENEAAYQDGLKELQDSDLHTKVFVREQFARRLDVLRQLRKTAMQDLSPETVAKVGLTEAEIAAKQEEKNEAIRKIYTSEYKNTLLPEHMGFFLDRLPDHKSIRELVLHDETIPERVDGNAAASADIYRRRIGFYKGQFEIDHQVQINLNHERSHLSEGTQPVHFALYQLLANIEPYAGREYGLTNKQERRAVDMEQFTHINWKEFEKLAVNAPLRTLLLADSERAEISTKDSGHRTEIQEDYRRRLDFVDTEVAKLARNNFSEMLASNNFDTFVHAVKLAQIMLANKETVPYAQKVIDSNLLVERINDISGVSANPAEFNWVNEAKRVMSLELLKELDSKKFAEFEQIYKDHAKNLGQAVEAILLDLSAKPQTSTKANEIIDFAESLKRKPADDITYNKLFPNDALHKVAENTKDLDLAKRIFGLLISPIENNQFLFQTNESNSKLARKLIKAEDTELRNNALMYLAQSGFHEDAAHAYSTITEKLNSGDLSALERGLIPIIHERFTAFLNEGRINQDPQFIFQVIAKYKMLEKIREAGLDQSAPGWNQYGPHLEWINDSWSNMKEKVEHLILDYRDNLKYRPHGLLGSISPESFRQYLQTLKKDLKPEEKQFVEQIEHMLEQEQIKEAQRLARPEDVENLPVRLGRHRQQGQQRIQGIQGNVPGIVNVPPFDPSFGWPRLNRH